jgi:hypothetical protein
VNGEIPLTHHVPWPDGATRIGTSFPAVREGRGAAVSKQRPTATQMNGLHLQMLVDILS